MPTRSLSNWGDNPTPAQVLNINVCDPAMGSAAFLVEACHQLGDALTRSWHAQNEVPGIPPDEDEALYAQRMVAQRCLYGLDKNPMAADLANLSLWLATLAKDHPFTFLDHSLRHGEATGGAHAQGGMSQVPCVPQQPYICPSVDDRPFDDG